MHCTLQIAIPDTGLIDLAYFKRVFHLSDKYEEFKEIWSKFLKDYDSDVSCCLSLSLVILFRWLFNKEKYLFSHLYQLSPEDLCTLPTLVH